MENCTIRFAAGNAAIYGADEFVRVTGKPLVINKLQPGIDEVRTGRGVSFKADEDAVGRLSQALIDGGVLIKALAPQTVTLEDLFFSLTEDGKSGAIAGHGLWPGAPDRVAEAEATR